MPHSQYHSPKSWQKHKPRHVQRRSSSSDMHRRPHKNSLFSIIKHIISRPFAALSGGQLNGTDLFKKALVFVVVAGLFGSLGMVAAFGYFSRQLPDVHSILTRYVAESTKIYDRTGETLLYEIHGDEKRTIVELENISSDIINALISAEDKNFYHHKGFSIIGFTRAAIQNTLTGSTVGGSTLTQQMIKNTVLTKEKTYTRKIKELILARKAEQEFSKDEILKIYLNTINYGGVNYGVESAAQAYFGKSAKDVTLAEAAILAAIPQRPSYLSPYGNNTDALFARQRWVLDRMVDEGYISREMADAAKQEELTFKEQRISGDIKAPHFVFYVRELLVQELGEDIVNTGGLKVITTLDWEKQQVADQVVTDADEFNLTKGATNASLVSLDAKTGEILAMVGSQDYFDDEIDGKVNIATSPRQPGSSIKPIVYAAAIEKGYTDKTVVYDVNTNFAVTGKAYEPKNYDLKEHGPITFRNALQGSLNIAAVKALYLAGVDNVMKKMGEELGYSTITPDLDCGLSLVLGGCEVTLLDHVGAYTAFARDGERAHPQALLAVYDTDGEQLFEFKEEKTKAWDPQVARTMNSILSDNAARAPFFGANSHLYLGSRPVAAKTGTTNDYNDAWTIGYTPSFVTGVWVGNADGTDMDRGGGGSTVAAPIWNAFMRGILDGTPVETFKEPDPLPEDLKPVLTGNIGGQVEVEVDKFSGKLATEYTPASTKETRVYRQDHTILHYVLKDNPRGPAPEDPVAADSAYAVWEQAVQDWVIRDFERRKQEALEKGEEFNESIHSDAPPTEYDDVHLPEFTPSISILSPNGGQTITSSQLSVSVNAYAPRGMSRVEYYIDDEIVGISTAAPYSATLNIPFISTGFHTLKAVAYDDVDNQEATSIDLNFKVTEVGMGARIISPTNNQTITTENLPLTISAELTQAQNVDTANVIYVNDSGFPNLIQSIRNPSGSISAQWFAPGPGSYTLYIELTGNDNSTARSSQISVTVTEPVVTEEN